MATSLNPFCSKRLMMSPTNPRWTPSGLIMMKVRSVLAIFSGVVQDSKSELPFGPFGIKAKSKMKKKPKDMWHQMGDPTTNKWLQTTQLHILHHKK